MMYIEALLPRQSSSCVTCSSDTPACSCSADQDCVLINRSCTQCSYFQCQAKSSDTAGSTVSSGGVSKGALAGAIVAVLVLLATAVALFVWYRRSPRFRSKSAAISEVKPDLPAAAADVLNRPDPVEKHSSTVLSATEMNTVRVYSTSSDTTIDLDPESQVASQTTPRSSVRQNSNPFDDNHSIQTAGTEATNVIPIALVTPESQRASQTDTSRSASPVRPARSPDLDLNLDHANVSHDSLRLPAGYAMSQRSDVSGVSSRNSYMSNASYSSDFLNEAPMIITPNKGAVRQVLGVVKAEMINAPGHSPTSAEGLKPPTSRPAVRSPLAATSFGPSDLSDGASEDGVNPFSDKHTSTQTTLASSLAGSQSTFGQPSPAIQGVNSSVASKWTPDSPTLPWSRSGNDSRPSSMSTQAGSVVDIANATRVNVGLSHSGAGTPRVTYRTTMGRLVSPPTGDQGTFEEQQQRALAHAQAQAQAQGLEQSRRISGSSVLSATSTRADSILESFPFVPPSPISNRPMRSPPVSPLSQQAFSSSAPSSPLAKQTFTSPSSKPPAHSSDVREDVAELPAPPDRRTLGLSTGSQLSTASSGLGSFPFQIDSGTGNLNEGNAPTAFNGRQRASLDTLAITSDLSSYPLGYDRDSIAPRK